MEDTQIGMTQGIKIIQLLVSPAVCMLGGKPWQKLSENQSLSACKKVIGHAPRYIFYRSSSQGIMIDTSDLKYDLTPRIGD